MAKPFTKKADNLQSNSKFEYTNRLVSYPNVKAFHINTITQYIATRRSQLLCTLLLLCANASYANVRYYNADVEDSAWSITKQTRLACELSHPIPGYGTASFMTEASKHLNLEFNLEMLRLPSRYDVADVYSMPPKWMRGAQQRKLGRMDLRKQYDGDLPADTAWNMLTELEKGFWPTIHYRDWLNSQDGVAVSLNASNFKNQYNDFNRCVANLLPFTFKDIAYTVIGYKKNSAELNEYSQRRLGMIGEYLKEDLALALVLVDGYSDSYGGPWLNEQLSIKRANEIRDFFASMGIDNERIEITGHGEKRHVAPNDTAIDREKNRRVIIQMSKGRVNAAS